MVTWKTVGSKELDHRGRGREDEEPGPGEAQAYGNSVGVPGYPESLGSRRSFAKGNTFFGEDEKTVKWQICCVSSRKIFKCKRMGETWAEGTESKRGQWVAESP